MKSSTEHERHAEEVRAQMAGTADEIRDRMAPGQLFEEALHYMRDSEGTVAFSNLGRQVRDNPLALALIGAGVAWLFAGPRPVRREYYPYPDDRLGYEDDLYPYPDATADDITGYPTGYPYDDDAVRAEGLGYVERGSSAGSGSSWKDTAGDAKDRVSGAAAGAKDRVSGAAADASGRISSSASAASQSAKDTAAGIGHSASNAAHSAAHGASSATASAGRMAARAGDYAAGAARESGRYASSAMHGAGRYASEAGNYAADASRAAGRYASDASRYVGRSADRARDSLLSALDREPLVIGALGLAVGAAIGAMLPSTRIEDETFGDARDELKDEAGRRLKRGYESAKDVAAESYAAARSSADEEGLTPKDDKPLAEKVGNVAATAAKTAKDSAKEKASGSSSAAGSSGGSTSPSTTSSSPSTNPSSTTGTSSTPGKSTTGSGIGKTS